MSARPLVTTAFFAVLIAGWELGVRVLEVKAYLLPPPSAILSALWRARAELLSNGAITAVEVLGGFAASLIAGTLVATLIHLSRTARATVYPAMVALQSIPKVGLAPLMVIWLGYGFSSKLLMAFLFAFFPVVIATLGGLASVPAHLDEHFRALSASRWTIFTRLQIPAALPNVLDGAKVAMPLAVIGAIVGEFVGSNEGLGNMILLATGASQTALTFAALTTVTLLSLLFYFGVELVSRLVWWRAV